MSTIGRKQSAFSWLARMAVLLLATSLQNSPVSAQIGIKSSPDAWKEIVSLARKEGRVLVYSHLSSPVMDRLKEDFAKAYPGITMEVPPLMGSGVMISKLDQERQAGVDGADVATVGEIGWARNGAKNGTLKKPLGPNASAWPPKFMLDGVVPVFAEEPIGILYNTSLVKTPIGGYADLLRPEYKKRVAVIGINATTMVAFWDWLEKTQGPEYLTKLAAQQPLVATSSIGGTSMVASGEAAMIIASPASQ